MELIFLVLVITVLIGANKSSDGELLRMAKHFLGQVQKARELPAPPKTNKVDPLLCEVYEERLVDLKMVKAGLMKPHEVAQCDNLRCSNCH